MRAIKGPAPPRRTRRTLRMAALAPPGRRRGGRNGGGRNAVEERYAQTERQSTGEGMANMTLHDISGDVPAAPLPFRRLPDSHIRFRRLHTACPLSVTPAPEPGSSLGSCGNLDSGACSPPAAAASEVGDGPRLGGRGDEREASGHDGGRARRGRGAPCGRLARGQSGARTAPAPIRARARTQMRAVKGPARREEPGAGRTERRRTERGGGTICTNGTEKHRRRHGEHDIA